MSCIENNKVDPEDWILEIIADKLKLDLDYLKHGVKEQIEENIEKFRSMNQLISIEDVWNNIEHAEKYNYYDSSCKLFQLLFKYYSNHGMSVELSRIIRRYYNSCQKSRDEILHINYYIDISKYLYMNEEYCQARSYIALSRKMLIELDKKHSEEYIMATYNQAVGYIICDNIQEAKEIIWDLEEILSFNENEDLNADIYKILAVIEIYLGGDKFRYYQEETIKRCSDLLEKRAEAYYDFGKAKFNNGSRDEALQYFEKALSEYPRNDKENLCKFLIDGSKYLIECEHYELASEYIEEVLNISIKLELVTAMERAYYYKAIIFEKKKNYMMAETYMMLSMDAFRKFGSKDEISKRYIELGRMYHEMGNVRESITYFDLAFKEKVKC